MADPVHPGSGPAAEVVEAHPDETPGHECGVFAGISSGAALAGAAKVASEIDEGTIVFIVCDGGWKYLSTGAYTDDLDEAEAKAEQIIYF